jgi:hypothetical protein
MAGYEHGPKNSGVGDVSSDICPSHVLQQLRKFLIHGRQFMETNHFRIDTDGSITWDCAGLCILQSENGYEYIKKRKWTKTRISLTMVGFIFGIGMLFHFWATGLSFTILGRTIDDPWGIRTVWSNFGQAMLALHGVLVPAAVYNALFVQDVYNRKIRKWV